MKKCFLAGNVMNKPECLKTRFDLPLTHFLLSTNRFSYQRGLWKRIQLLHSVLVYGSDAEICARYLEKGFPLALEGWWDCSQRLIFTKDVHFLGLRTNAAEHITTDDTLIAPKKGMED